MCSRERARALDRLEDSPLPCTAQHVTPLLCATLSCTAPRCAILDCPCTAQFYTLLSSVVECSALCCSALPWTPLSCCLTLGCAALYCAALHARLHQTSRRHSNMIKARRSGTCRGKSKGGGGGRGGGRMQPWPAAHILNLNH